MKKRRVLRKTLAISVLTLFLVLPSVVVFAAAPAPPPPPEPAPAYLPPAETADQVYVSFQSLYNNRYVHVENGCGDNIKADRYLADSLLDEIFIMNGSSGLQDGTTVNIRTACGDCYFAALPDGDLDAKTVSAGNNETFELINVTNPGGYLRDGDTIGLKSTHGKYVRVNRETNGLDARNTVFDQPWEMFRVIFHPEPAEIDCSTGLEDIHRVGLAFSNTYIVEGEKDGRPVLMVVDTGIVTDIFGIQQAISNLGYDNSDVELIYTTHAHIDHYGSAEMLRCFTGAKIMVHKDDADYMRWGLSPLGDMKITPLNHGFVESILGLFASVPLPLTPPDIIVADGDSLDEYGFTADVIHLPGHTYGSSGLLLTRGNRKIAFCGDLLGNRNGQPQVQASYAQNWDQIPLSVDKLKALNPDFVCSGHGEIFTGDVLHGF